MPRCKLVAAEMLEEGDTVVGRTFFSGVQEGDFYAIPATHKAVDVPITIFAGFKIAGLPITSYTWTAREMLTQLGIMQPTETV